MQNGPRYSKTDLKAKNAFKRRQLPDMTACYEVPGAETARQWHTQED